MAVPEVVRAHYAALCVGEDEVLVSPSPVVVQPLVQLPEAVGLQGLDDFGEEGHRAAPARLGGLAQGEAVLPGVLDAALDASAAGLPGVAGECEVFPLERQKFAWPQTGARRDDEEGLEAVPSFACRREERLDLLEGERRPLLFLGHPRRVGVAGGVVGDQTLLDRVLQRGPDGGVGVANRGNTYALVQLPLVEVLEILGGELV